MRYTPVHKRKAIGESILQKSEKEEFYNTNKKITKYTNIGLPEDLIEKIDDTIKNSKLGYRSRGEFVKEAVRNSLKELLRFK